MRASRRFAGKTGFSTSCVSGTPYSNSSSAAVRAIAAVCLGSGPYGTRRMRPPYVLFKRAARRSKPPAWASSARFRGMLTIRLLREGCVLGGAGWGGSDATRRAAGCGCAPPGWGRADAAGRGRAGERAALVRASGCGRGVTVTGTPRSAIAVARLPEKLSAPKAEAPAASPSSPEGISDASRSCQPPAHPPSSSTAAVHPHTRMSRRFLSIFTALPASLICAT